VDAPIFVSPDVLDEAGIAADEEDVSALAEAEASGSEEEEESGPVSQLQRMENELEKAVEEEDYEKAAELRDEIEALKREQNKN